MKESSPKSAPLVVRGASLARIDFDGLQILDYTAAADLESSLAVIDVGPGARHARAWSKRSDKFYLVTAGSIAFVVDGIRSELSAGDFCTVPRGSQFQYTNESSSPARLVLVHTPSFDLSQEVFIDD